MSQKTLILVNLIPGTDLVAAEVSGNIKALMDAMSRGICKVIPASERIEFAVHQPPCFISDGWPQLKIEVDLGLHGVGSGMAVFNSIADSLYKLYVSGTVCRLTTFVPLNSCLLIVGTHGVCRDHVSNVIRRNNTVVPTG